jgi:aminoglycoside phosphotransferase (APT) family kinase protein
MLDRGFIAKLLESIQREIADRVTPDLTHADARTSADMVYLLIGWLKTQIGDLDRLSGERAAALASLMREDAATGEWLPLLSRNLASGEFGSADPGLFADALEVEKRFLAAQDPEPPADLSTSFLGGRRGHRGDGGTEPVAITDETLTAYLRRRHPGFPGARASRVQRLPGGMGKETVLFRIDGLDHYDGDAVIRLDLPVLSTDNSVVNEFPLLVAVERHGVKVPQPLWCEPDRSVFGGAFIVVRKVSGSTDIGGWIGDPAARARFGRVLARTMAEIHALRPEDVGGQRMTQTAIEATRAYIEATRRFYRSRETAYNARIEAGFDYLLARSPADDRRPPALVHGDIGFHNLMIEEGDVTAVLDWDYAHFGDPAEDVSYCRPFVERILPWSEFLAEYHAHGGRAYGDEQDHYYAVWRDLRNAAACAGALGAWRQTEHGNIKLAMAGILYGPRFEIAALEAITRKCSP